MDTAGLFDFSLSGIMSGLIFGVIGIWMWGQARRFDEHTALKIIAVALMVYPYFTHGPMQDWGVGFILCGVAYYIWPRRNSNF